MIYPGTVVKNLIYILMAEESRPCYGQSGNVDGEVKDKVYGSLKELQHLKIEPGLMTDLHPSYYKDVDISQGHSSWPKPEPDTTVSEDEVPVYTALGERQNLTNPHDLTQNQLTLNTEVRYPGSHPKNEDGFLTQCVLSENEFTTLSPESLGDATDEYRRSNALIVLRCGEETIAAVQPNALSLNSYSSSQAPYTFRSDVADQDNKAISLLDVFNSAIYQPVVKLTRLSVKDLDLHSISARGDVDFKYPKMGRGQEMARHSCKFCTDRFNVSKEKLGDAVVVVESHGCTVCGRTFKFQCDLQFHAVTHKLKTYSCTSCEKEFKRKDCLLTHFRKHSGEKPFSCRVCSKKFAQFFSVKSHMVIHTGEKAFACRICPKKFTLPQGLRSHYLIHTGEKRFSCTMCTNQFKRRQELRSHMRVHSAEKPFSCDYCKKTFRHPNTLKAHSVTHTGERAYACSLCPKSFTQASHLRTHMATHYGLRHYPCSLCDIRFTQSSHLKTHMVVHTGEKPHRCETCQRCFANKGTLTLHSRQHTGEEPYACKLCPAKFKQLSALKGHLTKHTEEKPYKCEVCQKDFRCSSHLKAHVSSWHTDDKPYQCVLCGKRYALLQTLKHHMLSHTCEKPFVCRICSKSFRHPHVLKRHMNGHKEKQ